jgi:glutaredoxin-dependent peroxiredoxin
LGQRAAEIRSLGAEIVAVAVTAVFSQQAFAKSLGVDFPLVSDWNEVAAPAYGVQYDVWRGHENLAKRSLFVIDRDGIIRWAWVTEDALVMPDFDGAIAALRELQR